MRPLHRHIAQALFVIIVLSIPGNSRTDDDRRDGNWWTTLNTQYKQNYIVGFFDGMDLGEQFSVWKFFNKPADQPCVKKVVESFSTYAGKYLKDVTNVQISDGLDEFYKDYKNRRILVRNSVWLILSGIAGTPKDELDKMTENFRKNASQ